MIKRLFVYGTLAPGRPNEHVLAGLEGAWLEATITGSLQEEGWGAAMGYPAVVLDEEGGKVEGFLFTSGDLASNWPMLDLFEGEVYERVLTKATLNDGSFVDTYVYALKIVCR